MACRACVEYVPRVVPWVFLVKTVYWPSHCHSPLILAFSLVWAPAGGRGFLLALRYVPTLARTWDPCDCIFRGRRQRNVACLCDIQLSTWVGVGRRTRKRSTIQPRCALKFRNRSLFSYYYYYGRFPTCKVNDLHFQDYYSKLGIVTNTIQNATSYSSIIG